MSKDEVIEDLRQTCANQAKVIEQLQNELKLVHEERRLALNRLFKRSSEHMNAAQETMVFDEAEAVAVPAAPEPTIEEVVVKRKKKAGKRQEQIANLEQRDIEYPASEEQQICPCCGEKMHLVDWQVSQEIEYIPAKAVLLNHKQPVYACRDCQEEGEAAPIHTIPTMPELAFPKSLASPSLVSHIITQKFVMAAPLYRQEQNMIGLGIVFSRQTLANWMIRAATLLQPLYNRMHQILLEGDIIHADETTLQVLHEPGRAATTDSTMWLYRTGRDRPPILLYEYQTSRAGKHAKEFLRGFGQYNPVKNVIDVQKYLITDGHEGYNSVPHVALIDDKKVPDIIQGGCWAHVRRKFYEIATTVPKADRKPGKRIVADEGLKFCNDLFELEGVYKTMTFDERYAARLEKSAPMIAEIKAWLDKTMLEALPNTGIGKAIEYCINQWDKLTTFLRDGRIEIDNNSAERAIKPFVIGRKNWLFANTVKGAKSSAILYSIVETAKENNLIPFEYIKFLLEQIPGMDTNDSVTLDTLLPWQHECEGVPTRLPWSNNIPQIYKKS